MTTLSSTWTSTDLDTIDRIGEVDVATRRRDGTLRSSKIVWIARHDDAVYVRSVNGTTVAWYRGVQTRHEGQLTAGRFRRDVTFAEAGDHAGDGAGLDAALDVAYRHKYGHSSAVTAITAGTARDHLAHRPRLNYSTSSTRRT